jgi:hypothetical protein
MAFPFGQLPTLRQFLDAAIALGCEEVRVPGITGPDGKPVAARCLVGPAPKRIPYPLPAMRDNQRMTPSLVGSIERTLGITTGFPSI